MSLGNFVMPSQHDPIMFRLIPFKIKFGKKANKMMKAIAKHPQIEDALKNERCPICGKSFDECEYFRGIENE